MASWSLQSDENVRSQVQPDPRPARRLRASHRDWEEIRADFAGQCCVACSSAGQLELHHILPRSQGGSDVVENLVVICRSCHTKLEGHETGWERIAAAIRKYVMQDPARRGYQDDHNPGFSRRYPPLPNTDPQFLEDFRTINESHMVEGVEFS
jgi:hypothetical protein